MKEVDEVLGALDAAPYGLSIPEIMARANVSKGRIDKTLQLLSLEAPSPVRKEGSKWILTGTKLPDSFWERARRLTDLRREEQAHMQEYVSLEAGHMEFLISALDGDPVNFQPPKLSPLPTDANPTLVQGAITFLQRTSLDLEPRRMWPTGGLSNLGVSGRIPPALQARPGKILCNWGDAGWGHLVQQGKLVDNHYADALVEACAAMYRTWNPQPAPTWVACIPSKRQPRLVLEFGQRLAKALRLGFYHVVSMVEERPPQKTMANSNQQASNIDGALAVRQKLPPGPMLLVDDTVDSRWSMTVAAYLIAADGSGPVHPLVLASAQFADD